MLVRDVLQDAWRWVTASYRSWLCASWCGLVLALVLIACFGTDAGLSYDEYVQRNYGDMIVDWFTSGFKDDHATRYKNLYYYGGLFDLLCQAVARQLPFDVYDTRHIITALTALLGVVATWLLAARLNGARAGLLAACMLALTPCWTGHGLFNPKDIPFGTAAAFASFTALRLLLGPAQLRVADVAWAGVAVGIALAIRPGGMFVLGYPCATGAARLLLELVRRWRAREPLRLARLLANLGMCVVLVVVIAWPLMLSTWPWAQLDPWRRPFEAMAKASHFSWKGDLLFDGHIIRAEQPTRWYLPVWFKVTLPETYLLAALAIAAVLVRAALRRSYKPQRLFGFAFLACCVIAPFSAALIMRPVLYDAQRHVLFLLPPAAAIGGCALSAVIGADWLPRSVRLAFASVLAGVALCICVDMVQLHPYEYVYFNRWSGGLRKQYNRFETDYWSVSYREGLEWVRRDLVPTRERTRVIACDSAGNQRLQYYRNRWHVGDELSIARDAARADVILAVRRYNCHIGRGAELHVVSRQGAPLLYVQLVK